jgi:hypothetical protein
MTSKRTDVVDGLGTGIKNGVLFVLLGLLFICQLQATEPDSTDVVEAMDDLPEWISDNYSTVNGVKVETRMYIPADHKVLRGIIVWSPGFGGDGRGFATLYRTKVTVEEWGFAAVGLKFPTYTENYIYANQGSGQALLNSIAAHAAKSGHAELLYAPLLMFGFSHGGAFAYSFTLWRPSRVIAFACNKSGYATTAVTTPAARAVPGVFFFGEFDHETVYARMSAILLANRALGARWSLAEGWGAAHEPGGANNLIFPFFDQAIKLRIPEGATPLTGPVVLNWLAQVDGYLGDNASFGFDLAVITTYWSYPEDKLRASWLPDAVTADKWQECVTEGRVCLDYFPL